MKKILISDAVSQSALGPLSAEEFKVDYEPEITAEDLAGKIREYDALIVRSRTKVTAAILEKAERLIVIGRAGTGVDNVNLEEATRRGVVVMNVPGGNTVSAAEHTMAMMLAMSRGIPSADRSMRSGKWERKRFVGAELEGKTLGVIGMGKIGREVAHRARAFGMEIAGYDPFISAEDIERSKVTFLTLPEIFKQADFITVHTPLMDETRHLIGDEQLSQCKRGVRIINCARGGIIDEKALEKHLAEGQVGGAALDVYETEPPGAVPLGGDERAVLTPHLAASTAEAQEKVAVNIAEQVRDYLLNGIARNAVNTTPLDPKIRERLTPYLVVAEKLGRLQAQLVQGHLKKVSVEYSGDIPPEALPPLTVAILKGYFERFLSGPVNAVNATYIARERGIRLDEVRTSEPQDYTNLITCVFESDQDTQAVAGTVFGRNIPRIVRLDGFRFDATPEGQLLMVSNDDRPGVVGMIGRLLGDNGINIATMALGRDRIGGQAIAVINLDEPLPEQLVEELRTQPGIVQVKTASL